MLEIDKLGENELMIVEALKEVIDPELYVNIVDLGLVYNIVVKERPVSVDITMTFTSKGCPMGDAIIQDIEQTLYRLFPGIIVNIELVWDPEWTIDFVTEEGNIALRVG